MVINYLNKIKPKRVKSLIILFALLIQFSYFSVILVSNKLSSLNNDTEGINDPIIIYQNGTIDSDSLNVDEIIKYYEQTYKTFVEKPIPNASYNEESGYWIKGDPGVHTIDGDFYIHILTWDIHVGSYEKTVEQLVQEAMANGCDFIGFTNLDGIRITKSVLELIFQLFGIPTWLLSVLLGGSNYLTITTDWEAYHNALIQARWNHRNDNIFIFYGVEKTMMEDYQYLDQLGGIGMGKRMQCLLPYRTQHQQEQMYMDQLIHAAPNVESVLNIMNTFYGDYMERGSAFFSPNIGKLFEWGDADFQRMAQEEYVATGVVAVAKDQVDPFIEFNAHPSNTNWDKCLDNGWDIFGAVGSDNYENGEGGPGLKTKTYVKVWSPGYYGVMEGFKLGRVFTAQGNCINSIDLTMEDNYDQKAYMGDTMVSYGNQTVKFKIGYNTTISQIKVITNYDTPQGYFQIYKTYTNENWTNDGHYISANFTLPHSEDPYFVRLEGIDTNGNRFFSAPVYYKKSTVIFPEIHITEPYDGYITNNASTKIKWTYSSELNDIRLHRFNGYKNPGSNDIGDSIYIVTGRSEFNNDGNDWIEDGWNTIMLKGRDTNTGFTAKDIIHIYCHKNFPVVSISNPRNNSYTNNNTILVQWQGMPFTGYGVENYLVWIDSGPQYNLSSTINTYTFYDVPDGMHEIHVLINQTINYETFVANITVYVDTQNPTINIESPTNNAVFNENKTEKTVTLQYTAADIDSCPGGILNSKVNIYKDIDNNGTWTLIQSVILEGETVLYNLTWADGKYKVNITTYDLAGNNNSAEVIYHIDLLPPLVWLPLQIYFGSDYANINWIHKDSATDIDIIKLVLENGTVFLFDKTTTNKTIQYPGEGKYKISLIVNDTQGHETQRNSTVFIDKTNPIIYTVWVNDQFYKGSGRYFRVGLTVNDIMSGIKNITLNYNITNTQSSYASSITIMNILSYRIEFEIPYYVLNTYTPLNEANVTFNFEAYDKVGHNTKTQNFKYELKLTIPQKEKELTVEQIFIIFGIVVGVSLGGVYIAYKLKRRRDFGEFAKYY